MGPLGLLSPHPGVSYLFSGENSGPSAGANQYMSPNQHSNPNLHRPTHSNGPEDMSSSLWGIANATLAGGGAVMGGPGGSLVHGGALASPPASWSPALGEMVLKIDGKFKVHFLLLRTPNQVLLMLRKPLRKSPPIYSRSSMHSPEMVSKTSLRLLILSSGISESTTAMGQVQVGLVEGGWFMTSKGCNRSPSFHFPAVSIH